MAQGVHTEKVAGGKLLRVKVDVNEAGKVSKVQVLGDFFIHPEEFVEEIEQLLFDYSLLDEEAIAAAVKGLVLNYEAELVGITSEAIAKAFVNAKSNAAQQLNQGAE